MNEKDQNNQQNSNSSLNQEKGSRQATQSSNGFKKLLAKKWFSPAVFMISAALIVTLLLVLQETNKDQATTGTDVTESEQSETVGTNTQYEPEVAATSDDMIWPVSDISAMTIEIPYYDLEGTLAEKEAALVQVGTTFAPHMGVDLVREDGSSFEVLAALDGVVSLVENNPINGNIVEINHGNGFVTVYQSLTDVTVEQGDEVEQGDTIAKAGRSDIEKDLGAHLHFEARLNGQAVNPQAYIVE